MTQRDERRARLDDPNVHLIMGSGDGINGTTCGCVMNWANFIAGGDGAQDDHPCVDPSIRAFCVRINDGLRFTPWRDELKPYAFRILDTASPHYDVQRTRANLCADWAVRTITPLAFDFWGDTEPEHADEARSWAKKLRDLGEVVGRSSAEDAQKLALGALDVARSHYRSAAVVFHAASASSTAASLASCLNPQKVFFVAAAAADCVLNSVGFACAWRMERSSIYARTTWDASLALLDRLIAV